MKTVGRFALLVLPFALCCGVLAQQSNSSRKNNEHEPTASRGSDVTPSPAAQVTRGYVAESKSGEHDRPKHHPPHFHNNGGFAYYPYYPYSPYANEYATVPLNSGQTATDRLIANGGTFALTESAPADTDQPGTETTNKNALPQAPMATTLPPTAVGSMPSTTFAAGSYETPGLATAVEESPAILVFADGHRLEVRNYAVFGGSVIVMGAQRQRIPLSQLDLKATLAANDAAGYSFRIPAVYLK